jgi:hypothetical protein
MASGKPSSCAHVADRRRLGVGKYELGVDAPRPLDEEPARRGGLYRFGGEGQIGRRNREGRHGELALAAKPQRDTAGGQHDKPRGVRQHLSNHWRGGNEMLNVVEDYQNSPPAQKRAHTLLAFLARRFS